MTGNIICTNIPHFQASAYFQSYDIREEMEGTLQTKSHVLMVGLSGPTSAGKTTLAHLFKHVFPNVVFILHTDDFCNDFEDIPTVNGYIDCDGPEGVDFARIVKTLDYIKANAGNTPPNVESWQADVFQLGFDHWLETPLFDRAELGVFSEFPSAEFS